MDCRAHSRISRLKAKCAAATKRQEERSEKEQDKLSRKRARSEESGGRHSPAVLLDQEEWEEDDEAANAVLDASFAGSLGQVSSNGTIEDVPDIPPTVSIIHDDGWTLDQICSLLLYVAKSTGTSNATFGKFLKVIALVIDSRRSSADPKKRRKCPQSAKAVKSLLKIKRNHCEKIVYICPSQRQVRKKRNETWETELCGYVLRETGEGKHRLYHCDLCNTDWDRKVVEKDGNHFVINPVRGIAEEALKKYGRLISPNKERVPGLLRDVTDGRRFEQMDIPRSHIILLFHADSAEFSKSTKKKMYLIFVQVLNLPLRVRRCVWHLAAVWVGEDLPKDRECFLVDLTLQLQQLDENSATFLSIQWTDAAGEEYSSPGYVYGFLSDSPERTAINGHLSHSACQGCIYCLQVGESIAHKICYKYVKNPPMKSHEDFIEMSAQWEHLSPERRRYLLEKRRTKGFRRPSLVTEWPKMHAVDAFFIDIMHMFDEGVSRWLLRQIVEGGGALNLTKTEIKQIDTAWLRITVPGHESRKTRSITQYRKMKEHELRFFIQHGAPYITKEVVPEDFHTLLCLASRIAWLATQDSISEKDIETVDRLSDVFLRKFERYFGEQEMKFSIHLVQHMAYSLRLHGPLQNVSCYGPENEIGVIGRRICSLNNTTKNIMNDFRTLSECSVMVEELVNSATADQQITRTARLVMGMTESLFYAKGPSGTCRLIGGPEKISSKRLSRAVEEYALEHGHAWSEDQIYLFKRAVVEVGIPVRTRKHNENSCRNESIVLEKTGKVIAVKHVVAIIAAEAETVLQTFVFGNLMLRSEEDICENRFVRVKHVYEVRLSQDYVLILTGNIIKQLVILENDDSVFIVSPPGNVFRVT